MITAVKSVDTNIVCLTDLQRVLWQLGLPILDGKAVSSHKRRAKLLMLWRTLRWPLLGMTALMAFECLGRDAHRAGIVGGAVVVLAQFTSRYESVAEAQCNLKSQPSCGPPDGRSSSIFLKLFSRYKPNTGKKIA